MIARPTSPIPGRRRYGSLFLAVSLLGAVVPAPAVRADDPTVAFERQPDGLRVTIGGRPFARYVYGTEAITRPFLEAVRAPKGTQVTRSNPPVEGVDLADHPTFHPGLWLAFGDLDGADSWRNRDRIRHAGFAGEPKGGPGRGSFAVRNRHEKGGEVIAEETCRITVLARSAGHLILWDSEFRPAGGELAFGDQEEMGLGVRVATPLAVVKGGRIIDSEGRVNEAKVWGQQAAWCSYAGKIAGNRVGVALMPHPENFRRSWFHARDYGLLEANPFGRNAFTKGKKSRVVVREGEMLRLRFGVLAYDGEPALDAAYRDYLKQAGSADGRSADPATADGPRLSPDLPRLCDWVGSDPRMGRLAFLEHGLSDDPKVRAWQRRLNPIESVLGDGCRLDLDVEAVIRGQPFGQIMVQRFEMDGLPRTHGTMYRGSAVK